jgi:pimeloyl-ACP methyl ester carboxylesterase
MAATARTISQAVESVVKFDPAITVPPRGEPMAPWTEFMVEGHHGRIAVRQTRGAGLPLLLVHGNSSSKDVFARQMNGALGARHRMIAIDLPGHGASDDARDPQTGYTLTGYADALVEIVESLGIERFAILGWSLGGHVAIEAAASAPGVVGLMIVGAPPIGTTPETVFCAFRPSPLAALVGQVSLSDADVDAFARFAGIDGDPALLAALRRADGRARGRVFEDVLTGGASDHREIVARLDVPLAIVNGADDPIVNHAYVEGLPYGSLWEGRSHTFPLAGHAPFLDAPDLFNATLARFMHDLEKRGDGDATSLGLCLGG